MKIKEENNIQNEDVKNVDKIEWKPNLKYDVKLNGILKSDFVQIGKDISEQTGITYDNTMRKISYYEIEAMNGKDVYSFTRDEILDMLIFFKSSSVNTLNVTLSIIRLYIDLAIERRYIQTNINQANSIKIDDLMELVNKQKQNKKIVIKETFYNSVEKNIKNYQDQAMLLLCFEGFMGKNFSELEYLKTEDFNFDNSTIKVTRDDEELIIPISTRLKNILYVTQNTNYYKLHNGKPKTNSNGAVVGGTERELLNLDETPYLLRPIRNKVKDDNEKQQLTISGKNIQTRMIKCCRMYMNMPFVTPSSIFFSGVIHRLVELSEQISKTILDYVDVKNYIIDKHLNLSPFLTYSSYKEMLGEE